MSPRAPEVTAVVPTYLITPDSTAIPISLKLDYWVADPFAVHAHFTSSDGLTITWVLARDLISSGLLAREAAPAGRGDVRIWRDQDPDYLLLLIGTSSSGQALLAAPTDQVTQFLLATRVLVPEYSETDQIDKAIDAVLAGILTP